MFSLFTQSEGVNPLMLPDSVQKANLADAIGKIANINVKELLSSLISDAVVLVLQILLALTIYAIGRWIIRRIVKLLDATFERREVDASLRSFMRHTIKMILTIMLILSVIQTLGVNVTSIIALFASATLAIGMALSGTAQNFAGGVMVLLMKPYRVGDFISAQGQSGEVKEIKLFSTVIQTADHQTIYIPNNSIATAIIDNYSTSEFRRVDWTIGMAYGNDVEVARETILGLLLADERILKDHDTVVWVASLGDSSVNLTVRAWVMNGDYWSVFFEYNEKFYKILPTKGIEFPFPQMDIHLKKEA
ncbi:MAG: mechanosensitive ion channel [Alistipes sp.]